MNSSSLLVKMSCLAIAICTAQSSFAGQPWSQDRQWLLGDWNGQSQQLEKEGYKFTAAIMSQSATNLDGGYNDNNSFENAAQLALGANFDLGKIAGWENTTANILITKRDGNSLTLERIKDPRSSALGNTQEIYGRGKIWRLTQAWVKKGSADNTVQFKIGRMGMSDDFNSSQCEFQNLLLCGGQLGKSIGSIWYNLPVGLWGTNLKYQFAPEWTLGIATVGKVHDSKHSFWLNAQQQLTQQGENPKRGLYISFNAVVNDKATTAVQSTQQLALWYKGPFDSRPNDSIGFGVANYLVNDRYTNRQIAINNSRGYDEYDALAANYVPVQRDELNVELNYTYQWSPAVMLRPNLQYIHQPAGVKEVDDAWVAGLSMRVNF